VNRAVPVSFVSMRTISAPRPVPVRSLALAVACLAVACGGGGENALVGHWQGLEGRGGAIEFREDGTASWTLGEDTNRDTFDIEWSLDPSASPTALDLTGFDHGPYAGFSLFCIVDIPAPEAFRLDCVPGEDPAARPNDFGGQALRFDRVDG